MTKEYAYGNVFILSCLTMAISMYSYFIKALQEKCALLYNCLEYTLCNEDVI